MSCSSKIVHSKLDLVPKVISSFSREVSLIAKDQLSFDTVVGKILPVEIRPYLGCDGLANTRKPIKGCQGCPQHGHSDT